MVRKMMLVLSLMLGIVFSTAPLVAGQSDVDVQEVAETVLASDTDALLSGLETPVADEELPAGFSGAQFADPEQATAEQGVLPAQELEGTVGSVAYVLDYGASAESTPAAGGEAIAEASPELDLSALSFGFASLNYVVFEDELTADDLENFKEGASEGIGDSEGEATIEDITVGDTDAVLLTYVIEESGVQSVVQMVAIPVGNTMVMSMVVLASTEVDTAAVRADAESLVLAGVEHLGMVAEGA